MWDSVHPSVLLGIVALGAAYMTAARTFHHSVPLRRGVSFAGALLTMVCALNGPVDALADDRSFIAHMAQHLLLTLVMPPLLLLGIPSWMLRPLIGSGIIRRLAKALTHPLIGFFIYNGFLAAIHTEPIFERMVRDEGLHIAIHILLMVTGTIMWWPLLSPLPELPRLTYPGQTLYLFLLLIPMAAISAPITLARHIVYPWYLEGPHPLGLTPLQDQVLGGLLMWVGAGLYLMCVFSILFFRWAQHDDRDAPLSSRPLRVVGPAVLR